VEATLERLKPNVTMRIGGAGNKCLHILDNRACYLIHTVRSMKYWDTCAAEALIRGRFGVVTDKDCQPVIYDATGAGTGNFTIQNGLIMARSRGIYDLCYERAGDYLRELKMDKGR
jgi:3'-phosphoadenosine 5'-phosphosulfate (PAPS) 3'-phosphatase